MPVLATVLFPVFSWSVIWFLQKMPGWQPFLDIWSILSILAYALAFALLESLIVLGLLIALAAIIPARALRAQFAALGSTIVLVTAFWTIIFQLVSEPTVRYWSGSELAFWTGLALLSIILAVFFTETIRGKITNFAAGLLLAAIGLFMMIKAKS